MENCQAQYVLPPWCALLITEAKNGEGKQGRRGSWEEGGGAVTWKRRKGGGRPRCQTVAPGNAKCPVGADMPGHAGSMGGARPWKVAGSLHSCPPPVGVGGSRWPCPKWILGTVSCQFCYLYTGHQNGYRFNIILYDQIECTSFQ